MYYSYLLKLQAINYAKEAFNRNIYINKRILLVTHGGVSIPIKCYFSEIPDMDTLLPLCIVIVK